MPNREARDGNVGMKARADPWGNSDERGRWRENKLCEWTLERTKHTSAERIKVRGRIEVRGKTGMEWMRIKYAERKKKGGRGVYITYPPAPQLCRSIGGWG